MTLPRDGVALDPRALRRLRSTAGEEQELNRQDAEPAEQRTGRASRCTLCASRAAKHVKQSAWCASRRREACAGGACAGSACASRTRASGACASGGAAKDAKDAKKRGAGFVRRRLRARVRSARPLARAAVTRGGRALRDRRARMPFPHAASHPGRLGSCLLHLVAARHTHGRRASRPLSLGPLSTYRAQRDTFSAWRPLRPLRLPLRHTPCRHADRPTRRAHVGHSSRSERTRSSSPLLRAGAVSWVSPAVRDSSSISSRCRGERARGTSTWTCTR